MLETMLALKNNDMRKIPGYDPEPVEKLRKLQRTLVSHLDLAGLGLHVDVSPPWKAGSWESGARPGQQEFVR